MKSKVNIKSNYSKTIVERVFDEAEFMLKNKATLKFTSRNFMVSATTVWRDMRKRLPYLNIGKYTQISELIDSHKRK